MHEDFSKSSGSTNTHTKRQMNKDLTYILHGEKPRKFGEVPKKLGNYERIAPSEASDRYLRMVGGQKMFGSIMKVSHKPELNHPASKSKAVVPSSLQNKRQSSLGTDTERKPLRAAQHNQEQPTFKTALE